MLRRAKQLGQRASPLLKHTYNLRGMSAAGSATRRMAQLAGQISTEAKAEPVVLFREHFAARIYTLNRPKKYNALTHEMVKLLSAQIEVRKSKSVHSAEKLRKADKLGTGMG